MDEAVATAQELGAAGFPPRLVGIGVERAFDALSEAEALALVELLAGLVARGALTADDLRTAVGAITENLEDVRCGLGGARGARGCWRPAAATLGSRRLEAGCPSVTQRGEA